MSSLYRVVLLAFPADFRRRHGPAMTAQFDEQRILVRGHWFRTTALWLRAIVDAIRHGLALRFDGPTQTPRPSALPSDLRHAWRSLVARRSTAALSVGLLAIAVAMSATIFGVVDALVLRPAPFPKSAELVTVNSVNPADEHGVPYMPPDLARLWQARTDLFARVGVYAQGGTALIGGPDETRQESVQTYITPGLLEVLGVRPVVGRTFIDGEGQPGRDRLVIIAESVWRSRFNRDRDVIGRSIVVNDTPLTIVGVMPETFRYPAEQVRVWRPFDLAYPPIDRYAQVIARTHGDRTLADLQPQVAAAAAAIMPQASKPWRYSSAKLLAIDAYVLDPKARQSLWLLFAATALLLLTACANISSLTMSQVFARARDMAIQSALGASRFRLVRQALAEQIMIGLAGLALAAPLAYAGIAAAGSLLPTAMTFSIMNVVDLDGRGIAFLVVLAMGTPLLAGVVPAFAGSRASVLDLLKHEGRSVTSGRASRVFRKALVVIEISCAVVLLVTGALLVRSFIRLQTVDRGFDSTKLIYAYVLYPARDFASPLSRRLYADRVLEELPRTAGVTAVTLTSGMPPQGGQISFGTLTFEDRPGVETERLSLPAYIVRPNFFSVTGIPVIQGRPFREEDTRDKVIVSASMAAAFWPAGSPVGQRYRWSDERDWYEVIGVAGEVRSYGLDDARGSYEVYFPYVRAPVSAVSAQVAVSIEAYSGMATFVARVDDPVRALPAIRDTMTRVDRHVMIYTLSPVESLYQESAARQRLLLTMMIAFSSAGLLVAAIGVYGVLAGLVTQRLREIGVRLMLGAEPRAMSRVVLRDGLALTGLGAAIGIVAAATSGRLMSSVLFDVRATDVVSYAAVMLILGVVAALAAWRPARRASRVDPATLLRDN